MNSLSAGTTVGAATPHAGKDAVAAACAKYKRAQSYGEGHRPYEAQTAMRNGFGAVGLGLCAFALLTKDWKSYESWLRGVTLSIGIVTLLVGAGFGLWWVVDKLKVVYRRRRVIQVVGQEFAGLTGSDIALVSIDVDGYTRRDWTTILKDELSGLDKQNAERAQQVVITLTEDGGMAFDSGHQIARAAIAASNTSVRGRT